ncbi:CCQ_1a_G0046980.mRNA.1.CDS.1 [Saccharomyces cerevisiae]|nr:CCQ_1a_G0046980.mRNA.1.CDS.1 [Saccharomyces cerevisiae]CAI7435126.1 CCQ_1a_G0046980.mRNA.1.CDS.1 [Saccharomyces cerevisiae]
MDFHTVKDGDTELRCPIPDTFDASAIIKSYVKEASEQGIHLRKAGVAMECVSVEGLDSSFLEGQTFGDILCLPWTIIKGIRERKNRNKMKIILKNVSLLAKPGEMVLVLGRPGAGCTSFLKSAAGETSQFAGGVTTGHISYDGIPQKEMMQHYKPDVIYNGEQDVHFPHLTVKQTLDFAISCKMPAKRVNNVTKEEYITANREFYAKIFGLTHTFDTKVGNDFISGVSGGERKRVSIAEALAAKGSIYCWDNATRGLDSSTALEFARAIRTMTNLLGTTALVTVYQASENIYETFDKVTVLYAGRQIFCGKTTEAKDYFENMGYLCPPRQSTAEYLTAITDPNGLHEIKPGFEYQVPHTADEFEKYWLDSPEYARLKGEIQKYKHEVNTEWTKKTYNESMAQEKSKRTRKKSYYTVSYWEQIRLCTIRGFLRIYGDKSYTVINTCAAIAQAFITGSLFYQAPSSTLGAFSRSGVLFFSLLYYSLMGLANISFEHRPILQKHKVYSLYHPSAEALASTISSFPFRMIGLTFFIIILYFLAGLHRSAGAFFTMYLFLTMCSEAITSLFQMVSSLCDTLSQANSIAGVVMLSIAMYSTYMIQLPSMHPWFKWISYILPIRYAFESMLNAEFHGRHMDCGGTLVPSGPGFENILPENQVCAFVGSRPGQSWVLGDDYLRAQYQYEYKNTWRNFGIMWCFLIGYIVLRAVFTEYKSPVKSGGDALVVKKGTKNAIQRSWSSKNDEENLNASIATQDMKEIASSNDDSTSADFEGLESTGVFIWKNVSFTIPHSSGQRKLLDSVSGYCVPGTLTALIGESGAGKTTLLNTLAQRNVGTITGDMLVDGLPMDASFKRRTGYVQQQDLHVAELTVKESLQFSARMRRPQSIPDAEKMEYVEKIISILEMQEFSEALVGEIGYGLNVEQRKKLSIGVELVGKPDLLLFLDEPTSGLDSQSAWAVVKMLKRLALAGQSILCTIHQPSATLFEQFDRLLLLGKGGQTIYFGEIGKNSSSVIKYFEKNGARKCQQNENPAEYILEAIGAGATASVQQNWPDIWQKSHEYANINEKINDMIKDLSSTTLHKTATRASKYATSYSYQFHHVLKRSSLTFWRNLNYIMAKMMLLMISGLFIGFTFFHVGVNAIGLQNSLFACFMAIVISAPATNQIQERATVAKELYEVRESKSNMFHWSLLLITHYLNELPYHLLFSTIFFVSLYFPLGVFTEASRSGVFYLNYAILFQLYYIGLALMILYMSPNLQSANVIVGFILSFLLSFCGAVQPASLMPGFWTFMWKLSPYTYFLQNLVGLLMHDKPVRCSKKELSLFNPPVGQTCGEFTKPFFEFGTGYIANPDATADCAYCQYKVGDEYLARINASFSYLWRNFGFIWAYILFNIAGMIVVYYVVQVKHFSPMKIGFVKRITSKFKRK